MLVTQSGVGSATKSNGPSATTKVTTVTEGMQVRHLNNIGWFIRDGEEKKKKGLLRPSLYDSSAISEEKNDLDDRRGEKRVKFTCSVIEGSRAPGTPVYFGGSSCEDTQEAFFVQEEQKPLQHEIICGSCKEWDCMWCQAFIYEPCLV